MNPIQYEDILKIDQAKMVTISPDGTKIAWVLTRADISKNCTTDILYCWSEQLSTSINLFNANKIHQIKWQGNSLYFIAEEKKQYTIICIENNNLKKLVISKHPISSFEMSDKNSTLYFSQIVSTSTLELKKRKEEGYVYRWGSDNMTTLTTRRYGHYEYEKVWQLDILTGKKILLTKLNYNGWPDLESLVSQLIISPNADYLAIQYKKIGNVEIGETPFLEDIIIVDLTNKKSYPLLPELPFAKINPCWISNSELIIENKNYAINTSSLWMYNAYDCKTKKLEINLDHLDIHSFVWNSERKKLIAISDKNIYSISVDPIQIDKSKIDIDFYNTFTWNKQINLLAGIQENFNQLPQVVRYDLSKHNITIISSLNSHIENLILEDVEAITITTETGLSTSGYLLYPIAKKEGVRYPLIIATYGFHQKTHKANIQEWHSTFPAQIFSREGYVVLLLNDVESFSQTYVDDHEKARNEEGWYALELFEHAITILDKKGLIDTDKMGLYGWSHGAFIVEFLISHSKKFKVASVGEGGDYNPGCFWLLGMQQWTKIFNNTFGGPPWGATLKNYLDFSPFFQADKINTPLLLEFSQNAACVGLEMYVPLRYLNIPAELVIYDDEEHNFVKPKARLASMTRKIEWFNYWLLGKQEGGKEDQYQRWNEMRVEI